MSIKSTLLEGILYTKLEGDINKDVVIEYIDYIYTLKDKIDYRYELHDHTKTASINLSTDEMRNIAIYSKKTSDIFQHSYLSIYAPSDFTYGIARMFKSFYEIQKHQINAEIFRNRNDAIQYLKNAIKNQVKNLESEKETF